MTTSVDSGLVTAAVVALLRSQFEPDVLVGDGRAPSPAVGADTAAEVAYDSVMVAPYLVVWGPVPVGEGESVYLGGSYLGSPESWERLRYQVVGLGNLRASAEGIASAAIAVLTDRDLSPPRDWAHDLVVAGHSVTDRRKAGKVPLDTQGGLFQSGGMVDLDVCIV